MKWRILNKGKSENVIEVLLKNRGLKTKKQQQEFLNPLNPYTLTPKSLGINPKELKKAISRIKQAIKKKEKIIVYGDYDADGVCATAIVWETLHQLGAQVMPFIPKREEGYGLKVERIDQFKKEGIGLIITVDQGVVQIKQLLHSQKIGLDIIVTDHHVLGKEKPKALAVVHTTKLAGAGVAWFLAAHLRGEGLDLATIGTITDIVPLTGPNRSLVKFGLESVKKTKRPGLLSLFRSAGLDKNKLGVYEIGYLIGPRLNAAGRMDDPLDSLRLVCTINRQRAADLAKNLDEKNRQRQALMEQTTVHAREIWLKENSKSSLIFISDNSYQEGIVGLVAGKLMEEFYRPAVVIAEGKDWSKASARSIDEFNIVEAVRTCADILGPHGGHPKAAGFSVETKKISLLKKRLTKLAEKQLAKKELARILKIDLELDLSDLNFSFYQKISQMAPFGEGNPAPVFATRQVKVSNARLVGNDGKHLKLKVISSKSKVSFNAIAFGLGHLFSRLSPDKPVDIAYNLVLDEWNGEKKLQLKIKDIKI